MSARHILCIGAHPDDCELSVGGVAARFRRRGDTVRFVSVTTGSKGHYADEYRADPQKLVTRRLAEAKAAAAVIGADFQCLGVPDGEVYVDLPATEAMVRCLRGFGEPGKGPDLVLFNRPVDYHRDHRYTAQLVLDATYMLTVPLMCPDTRHLDRMPAFAYWFDDFKDVQPFRADIAVPIDDVMEAKTDMVCQHVSQLFEWLPYNAGTLSDVPADAAGRRQRVAEALSRRGAHRAETTREALVRWLGAAGESARCAEAFQICEYGRVPGEDELRDLFPLGG